MGSLSRRTFLLLSTAAVTGCGQPPATDQTPPTGSPTTPGTGTKPAPQKTPLEVEGWGNLRGQFIYDGEPPERKQLEITADKEYCGDFKLLDESLIVSPENRGIRDIAVMRYVRRGSAGIEPHPSYLENAKEEIALENSRTRFRPHVLPLLTSQKLIVENKDPIADNVKIAAEANRPINQNLAPKTGRVELSFPNTERLPIHITCALHNWESSWLIVRDDPYIAVTQEDGSFEISNLPAGEHTFVVWQEKPTYIKEVIIDEKETQWQRGRFTVTIEPDKTLDMGKIVVPASAFK